MTHRRRLGIESDSFLSKSRGVPRHQSLFISSWRTRRLVTCLSWSLSFSQPSSRCVRATILSFSFIWTFLGTILTFQASQNRIKIPQNTVQTPETSLRENRRWYTEQTPRKEQRAKMWDVWNMPTNSIASKWPFRKMTGKSKMPRVVGLFVFLMDCLISKHPVWTPAWGGNLKFQLEPMRTNIYGFKVKFSMLHFSWQWLYYS